MNDESSPWSSVPTIDQAEVNRAVRHWRKPPAVPPAARHRPNHSRLTDWRLYGNWNCCQEIVEINFYSEPAAGCGRVRQSPAWAELWRVVARLPSGRKSSARLGSTHDLGQLEWVQNNAEPSRALLSACSSFFYRRNPHGGLFKKRAAWLTEEHLSNLLVNSLKLFYVIVSEFFSRKIGTTRNLRVFIRKYFRVSRFINLLVSLNFSVWWWTSSSWW